MISRKSFAYSSMIRRASSSRDGLGFLTGCSGADVGMTHSFEPAGAGR